MARQVILLHGWSDDSKSFKGMADFLTEAGLAPVPVWLGDYVSMSDHVTVDDVVKRMDQVLAGPNRKPGLDKSFDMIVHSTGGLVARKWIAAHYPDGKGCPVKRLVMVAPANFGSKLASTGKSPIGRIVKGLKTGGQVGTEILNALELASDFQWNLAEQELFVPAGHDPATTPSPYGKGKIWPFVIIGSHPYLSGFRQVVNENGSDGTVRVAAANLNAYGVTIDLRKKEGEPGFLARWTLRHATDQTYKKDGRPRQMFPFAVIPDRDHTTITQPGKVSIARDGPESSGLPYLLKEAFACNDDEDYAAIASRWEEVSEETHALAGLDKQARKRQFPKDHNKLKPDFFHQYFQVVVRVVDDHGNLVDDYYIEFFNGEARGKAPAVVFHREVLEDVHPSATKATRCFYIDRSDLMSRFYGRALKGKPDETLNADISAASPGDLVWYFDRKETGRTITIHGRDRRGRFLRRNCTHFVKIVVPRTPADKVFRLSER